MKHGMYCSEKGPSKKRPPDQPKRAKSCSDTETGIPFFPGERPWVPWPSTDSWPKHSMWGVSENFWVSKSTGAMTRQMKCHVAFGWTRCPNLKWTVSVSARSGLDGSFRAGFQSQPWYVETSRKESVAGVPDPHNPKNSKVSARSRLPNCFAIELWYTKEAPCWFLSCAKAGASGRFVDSFWLSKRSCVTEWSRNKTPGLPARKKKTRAHGNLGNKVRRNFRAFLQQSS